VNIRIVREAGGVGDVVRVLPVLAALRKKHPDATLWLYAPPAFKEIYEHGEVPHRFVPTPMGNGRRPRLSPLDESKWPYLKAPDGVTFDLSVDLYCPGFEHEIRAGHDVTKDRIQCFCEAAGVWPCYPLPQYHVRESERAEARAYIEHDKLRDGKRGLIGLQPFSTDPARDWPEAHWVALANALEAAGFGILVFDVVTARARRFRQQCCTAKPLWLTAAVVAECDLVVTPDSGLFHLAAAVDTPALGLFASQSGEIMSRWYPKARPLSPARDVPKPEGCEWPCFWRRPRPCQREVLKRDGRTCPVLAELNPVSVLNAALRPGDGRQLTIAAGPMIEAVQREIQRKSLVKSS
jgi:ADP-heptose:LPS heptosyltransferase